jgi:hypothetical protein
VPQLDHVPVGVAELPLVHGAEVDGGAGLGSTGGEAHGRARVDVGAVVEHDRDDRRGARRRIRHWQVEERPEEVAREEHEGAAVGLDDEARGLLFREVGVDGAADGLVERDRAG